MSRKKKFDSEEDSGFYVSPANNNDRDFSEIMYHMLALPKPFGILWDFDKMEDFLKFKGYKIIERTDEESGRTCKMAIKPGDKYIPDFSKGTNILDIFTDEVQDSIINWLKKIS